MALPLPNNFQDTVNRIAGNAVKSAAYSGVPQRLSKLAAAPTGLKGFADLLLGSAGKQTGSEKVLGTVLGTSIGSLLAAGGGMMYDKYRENSLGNLDQFESHNRELGQLTARSKFKDEAIKKLGPIHKQIIKDLKKNDEIIRDADSKMVDSTYRTMTNFAPLLAADENAAKSFIRTTIQSGADHPGFNVLQAVTDAERSVQQAGGIISK